MILCATPISDPEQNVIPLPTRSRASHSATEVLPNGEPVPERMERLSDDELMLLARSGIEPAFDALVRRYQSVALRTAAKFLGRAQLARDVAQNVFFELYRYLPRYQPRGKFRSFFYHVLINQCRMMARATRNDRFFQGLSDSHMRESTRNLPDEQLIARERRREVERVLTGLSQKTREVLILHYAGELSFAEISEVLGLPLGTVKSRLFAGLEKLRSTLEEVP